MQKRKQYEPMPCSWRERYQWKVSMPEVCYLCGEHIEEEARTVDHVPPRQFFPTGIRQRFRPDRLLTLPTHRACNESYQLDEDYFVHTIAAVSNENPILLELWRDISRRAQRPESRAFNLMILNQIQEEARSPSGIIIPGRSQINYDRERINRVVWKIIRGLFFLTFRRILPEDTIHYVVYIHGRHTGLDNPEIRRVLEIVLSQEDHGEYGRIFAYKFLVNRQDRNFAAWALLFWNRHIFLIIHHDPECDCERCRNR